MTKFKTESESYFAKYLEKLGLPYSYEREWGGPAPDFTIYSDLNDEAVIAIADNKDFDYTKNEKKILKETGQMSRSSDPYKGIRKKIEAVRKQFKYAKGHPCIPILYSYGPAFVTPLIVYGAMFGDIGISIPIKAGGGQDQTRRSHSFFGKGGKMINEQRGQPQNQTITAIGILGHTQPEAITSGYEQELKNKLLSVSVDEKDWLEKTKNIVDELTQEMIGKGFIHLEETAPCVDFIVNPFSKLPFPTSFFKRGYTFIHEYDPNTEEIKLIYDWTKNPPK